MCQPTTAVSDIDAVITSTRDIGGGVSIISFNAPDIARNAQPGNFVNVKVGPAAQPLLRRPFSIHNVEDDVVELMVKNIGCGTSMLCQAPEGSCMKVIGPLGNSFTTDTSSLKTALLVSGGIGTAPMLLLEKELNAKGIETIQLVGGRTKEDIHAERLHNCMLATDDGSAGFKGNVVELLEHHLDNFKAKGPLKVFACGPNPMLNALAASCRRNSLSCEVSLETVMGCGIGICYGCQVELRHPSGEGTTTILLCQDGPVVDANQLLLT
ncbi:dihydroorotate dehydrogenase electron transfer subunit [Prosthecochloris vibrioformis]|uniref:Dihydroorotate dehydrogenase electron transfer subunit n=1 Tax=Prosthecochloris vibrioformis TaxID=1098 RepID=A0A5C4S2Z7_PROVB|nr:dihydroorotate dehydrogenase electron transfer subunit [Prosthecochloris vibrioformis]TNJ37860.1 dihydroorotate dehydrogenase electron transfer subunit [Prosthecochloris vibrioformis]